MFLTRANLRTGYLKWVPFIVTTVYLQVLKNKQQMKKYFYFFKNTWFFRKFYCSLFTAPSVPRAMFILKKISQKITTYLMETFATKIFQCIQNICVAHQPYTRPYCSHHKLLDDQGPQLLLSLETNCYKEFHFWLAYFFLLPKPKLTVVPLWCLQLAAVAC